MASDEKSQTPMDRLEDSLGKLRDTFVRRFPTRVGELRAQWAGLLGREDLVADLREMHRATHGLVGTAGSLGLTAITESALEIEDHHGVDGSGRDVHGLSSIREVALGFLATVCFCTVFLLAYGQERQDVSVGVFR